jgi:hypothetical protein
VKAGSKTPAFAHLTLFPLFMRLRNSSLIRIDILEKAAKVFNSGRLRKKLRRQGKNHLMIFALLFQAIP